MMARRKPAWSAPTSCSPWIGRISPSAAWCTRCSSRRPSGSISGRRWHCWPCSCCIDPSTCASAPFPPTRSNISAKSPWERRHFRRVSAPLRYRRSLERRRSSRARTCATLGFAEIAPILGAKRPRSFGRLVFGAALLHGERARWLRRTHKQRAGEHRQAYARRNSANCHGSLPKDFIEASFSAHFPWLRKSMTWHDRMKRL
jgi:hypothetical protein